MRVMYCSYNLESIDSSLYSKEFYLVFVTLRGICFSFHRKSSCEPVLLWFWKRRRKKERKQNIFFFYLVLVGLKALSCWGIHKTFALPSLFNRTVCSAFYALHARALTVKPLSCINAFSRRGTLSKLANQHTCQILQSSRQSQPTLYNQFQHSTEWQGRFAWPSSDRLLAFFFFFFFFFFCLYTVIFTHIVIKCFQNNTGKEKQPLRDVM